MHGEWRTDVGAVRTVNEDALYLKTNGALTLAIVADGMGGHRAGDIASQLAVEVISQQLEQLSGEDPPSAEEAREKLVQAIAEANLHVYNKAKEEEKLNGMGTTVVAALFGPYWGWIAHIGDSRAYVFRNGQLKRLTSDHSLVNELIKSGQLLPTEAKYHPQRNVLLRALGTHPEVEVDVCSISVEEENIWLLCTDGLTSMISDVQLEQLLQEKVSLKEMADRMMEAALKVGSKDNISFILLSSQSNPHQSSRKD